MAMGTWDGDGMRLGEEVIMMFLQLGAWSFPKS